MQRESAQFEYSAAIAEDHPAANGHFVGNPIIPGTVIMEHVRVAFGLFQCDMHLRRMTKVRHTHVLRPGKNLTVKLRCTGRGSYSFVCIDCDANEIATGDFHAVPSQA